MPSIAELVSATGLQIDNRISVNLNAIADGIIIQAAHNTASCPQGETYVLAITDGIVGQWQ